MASGTSPEVIGRSRWCPPRLGEQSHVSVRRPTIGTQFEKNLVALSFDAPGPAVHSTATDRQSDDLAGLVLS